MTPTYHYLASECPAPQVPATALYAANATDQTGPLVADHLVSGGGTAGSQGLVARWNRNATRLDLLGRYGGGAVAVLQGLELSAGDGLTLQVSAGQAAIDGLAELPASMTLPLVDGVLNRVWLSRSGALNLVTSASANPLAPPDQDTLWVFLGAVLCRAGAIDGIDCSGRIEQRQGNLAFRTTADPGEPTDTPPAGLRFFTVTGSGEGGLYLWDGSRYRQLDASTEALASGVVALEDELAEVRFLLRQFLLSVLPTPLGEQIGANPHLRAELERA